MLSKALGNQTVLSGSVSQGKDSNSRSLQMMERPLLTADELKSLPKGEFVVMKTGTHPMRTRLRLFLDWGITFEKEGYQVEEQAARKVAYANKRMLMQVIREKFPPVRSEKKAEEKTEPPKSGGMSAPAQEQVKPQERAAKGEHRSAYNTHRKEEAP